MNPKHFAPSLAAIGLLLFAVVAILPFGWIKQLLVGTSVKNLRR